MSFTKYEPEASGGGGAQLQHAGSTRGSAGTACRMPLPPLPLPLPVSYRRASPRPAPRPRHVPPCAPPAGAAAARWMDELLAQLEAAQALIKEKEATVHEANAAARQQATQLEGLQANLEHARSEAAQSQTKETKVKDSSKTASGDLSTPIKQDSDGTAGLNLEKFKVKNESESEFGGGDMKNMLAGRHVPSSSVRRSFDSGIHIEVNFHSTERRNQLESQLRIEQLESTHRHYKSANSFADILGPVFYLHVEDGKLESEVDVCFSKKSAVQF